LVLKFQTIAEKTLKNLGGYFFATPCTLTFVDICLSNLAFAWWFGDTMVLDLQTKGREFDSWSSCYQAITTCWMGDSLQPGKPAYNQYQDQLSLSSLWGR